MFVGSFDMYIKGLVMVGDKETNGFFYVLSIEGQTQTPLKGVSCPLSLSRVSVSCRWP
jgi:hypothetical protein